MNLYRAIVKSDGRLPENLQPKDVTERALEDSCTDCRRALSLFCVIMGRFGGNLALNLGTFGGVYIAGGIVPRFLDFFTAMIFACSLGIAVSAISAPMLLIQLSLATCAALILPLTTPAMMADFSAVGGLLLVATGLRICGIKMFAVVNMLPTLILAMPLSAAWTAYFA